MKCSVTGSIGGWEGCLKALAVICLILVFLLPGVQVEADNGGMPPLPHAFYGNITIDGEPAPTGATVTASVDGQVCGTIMINYPGRYGADDQGSFGPGVEKLVVQGYLNSGDTVEFFVDGAKAVETYPFEPGEVTRLGLTILLPLATPTPAATATASPTPADTISPGSGLAGLSTPVPASTPEPAATAAPTPTPSPIPTVTPVPEPSPAPENTPGAQLDAQANSLAPRAAFCVDSLSISPAAVSIREPVTCSVTVSNNGDAGGSYTTVLKMNGQFVDSQEVTLGPGESVDLHFAVFAEEAGKHMIQVGEIAGGFTADELSSGLSQAVISGIAAAAALVILAATLIVIRRRRDRLEVR